MIYDEQPDEVPNPTDPRIVAMHRLVDTERQRDEARLKADRHAKEAAVAEEEHRKAVRELRTMLGFDAEGMKISAPDVRVGY